MVAHLELALGRGHAGAHLTIDRSQAGLRRRPRWLPPLIALLTVPPAIALVVAAISSLTHTPRVHGIGFWLTGGSGTGFLLFFGPPLALIILAATRVRLHGSRGGGRWIGKLEARLAPWEIVAALVALAVAGVFFGHLAADAWACSNGVRSAC